MEKLVIWYSRHEKDVMIQSFPDGFHAPNIIFKFLRNEENRVIAVKADMERVKSLIMKKLEDGKVYEN